MGKKQLKVEQNDSLENKENIFQKTSHQLEPTPPILTKNPFKDLSKQFQTVQLEDPQKVTAYVKQITEYVISEQHNYRVDENYMYNQKDINEKMRRIMVDWLIDV